MSYAYQKRSIEDVLRESDELLRQAADDYREKDRREAYAAVAAAMEAYRKQTWYQTAWARIRFAAFYVTWKARYVLARFLVNRLGWDFGKTWLKLGL